MDQFGLLDEGFFIYAEDVDWCMRCRASGWRVVFYHEPQAIHYRGVSTTKKDPIRFSLTQQRSVLRFWKKHHGSFGRLSIRCFMFWHLLMRYIVAWFRYVATPATRDECRVRMQVSGACLSALFSNQGTDAS
jgi:GT2 family glycosyltransferase